jgi:hypothetical protein
VLDIKKRVKDLVVRQASQHENLLARQLSWASGQSLVSSPEYYTVAISADATEKLTFATNKTHGK